MDPTQAISWHDDNADDNESNVEQIPQILVSLTVKDKDKEDKVFELHEGTHSIGRTTDNKVVLSYVSISKKHALLEVSKSNNNTVYCFVTDCGSLNKTRLCRSDDEKGIVLTPNTRYEILPGSKLIFGDVSCQLTYHNHTADKELAVDTALEEQRALDTKNESESIVFKKPASLEVATQAYEVTDEELLNDLMHESRDVVPKRHASKWTEHATQPYDESESTTLGSMNNTAGNASLKSDTSTLWFKKDKHNNEEMPTQAYDEESTQGPERAEIKVIVTAPTQAYEEDAEHKDAAATQAYDEPSSPAKIKDNNATQVYEEESEVLMKDINATLAYEEPSSPVKSTDTNNNATQAYEEPSSPVKTMDTNATQVYEEPTSPNKTVDNNATQAYEEPSSPPKLMDVQATLAYEEDKLSENNDRNNATQGYEEPNSPKLPDNNNTTQVYEEPSSPIKSTDNNVTQAYVEADEPPVAPGKSSKTVKFAEVTVTQIYKEEASPEHEEISNNNATLPIIEQHSPPAIDNNATLPIAEQDEPDEPEDNMDIDRPETSNKDEEPSSLFQDSHQRDQQPMPVTNETRHSDSSDTQGPAQSKVTVSSSSKITTSIVESILDNEATLMIVDSTEIKNNESLEATLRLPSTPPVHTSADSLSDEAVESMPSDLWFINKHKDKASEEAELSSVPENNDNSTTRTDLLNSTPNTNQNTLNKPVVLHNNTEKHTPSPVAEDESLLESNNNNTTKQQAKSKPARTLRKSLSPTRARTKIEPEEGDEDPTSKPSEVKGKVEPESQSAVEPKSIRGRRKSKSDVSEAPTEPSSESQNSSRRTTRRSSSVSNTNVTIKEERNDVTSSPKSDEQQHTPRKTNKRKLSQSIDDSPRANKRVKASPEIKSSQDKSSTRRKSTGSDVVGSDTPAPHILFTGFPEDTLKKYTKTVETLGGHTIADLKHVTECTHLVTDSAQRTVKFLAALNCVKHVVTSKWIEKCQKQHAFVDESSFALRDHTAERKFDFHLEQSLQRAAAGKVFDGVSFVLTTNVKPVPEDLKVIIVAAGGHCIKTAPKKVDQSTVIIACAEDLEQARTLHTQGYRVYTSEFVLSSVIRQEINYEANLLPDVSAPEPERKNRKKK